MGENEAEGLGHRTKRETQMAKIEKDKGTERPSIWNRSSVLLSLGLLGK